MDKQQRDDMCLGFRYKSDKYKEELEKTGGQVVGYVMLMPSGKRVVIDCGRKTYWDTRIDHTLE